jgi:hypothetical protein
MCDSRKGRILYGRVDVYSVGASLVSGLHNVVQAAHLGTYVIVANYGGWIFYPFYICMYILRRTIHQQS